MTRWTPHTRLLAAVIGLAVASTTVGLLGGANARAGSVLTMSLILTATTAIRVVAARGFVRAVYGLHLAGHLALSAAAAVWLISGIRAVAGPESTGASEALLALSYLLLLAAALLVATRSARASSGGVLDAATVAIALASAVWLGVLAPALERLDALPSTAAYVFLVTIGLSGSVGVVVGLTVNEGVPRAARPVMVYFAIALVLTLLANVLSAAYPDAVTRLPAWWVGAIWPAAFAAAWGAIAHPAGPEALRGVSPLPSRLTPVRIRLLGLALVITPAIGIVRHLTGGSVAWLSGAITTIVITAMVLRRVSQLATAHHATEASLRALAAKDALTGLPNRRTVERRLEETVARVDTGGVDAAIVCFIDLNDFKSVNDTWGHAVGDEMLIAVSQRLLAQVRADTRDIVGRLGGDEFVVIVEPARSAGTARGVAERLRAALAEEFVLSPGPMRITASIGAIEVAPGGRYTADSALTAADDAMYVDKRTGTTPLAL